MSAIAGPMVGKSRRLARRAPKNGYSGCAAAESADKISARSPLLHSVSAVVTREAAAAPSHLEGIPGPPNPAAPTGGPYNEGVVSTGYTGPRRFPDPGA